MAQLWQIASSDNWKPRFSSMSQKLNIVFNFFPIISILLHPFHPLQGSSPPGPSRFGPLDSSIQPPKPPRTSDLIPGPQPPLFQAPSPLSPCSIGYHMIKIRTGASNGQKNPLPCCTNFRVQKYEKQGRGYRRPLQDPACHLCCPASL